MWGMLTHTWREWLLNRFGRALSPSHVWCSAESSWPCKVRLFQTWMLTFLQPLLSKLLSKLRQSPQLDGTGTALLQSNLHECSWQVITGLMKYVGTPVYKRSMEWPSLNGSLALQLPSFWKVWRRPPGRQRKGQGSTRLQTKDTHTTSWTLAVLPREVASIP